MIDLIGRNNTYKGSDKKKILDELGKDDTKTIFKAKDIKNISRPKVQKFTRELGG